jgi:hypothetical protein
MFIDAVELALVRMYGSKPAVLFHLVDVQGLSIPVVQLANLFYAILQFALVDIVIVYYIPFSEDIVCSDAVLHKCIRHLYSYFSHCFQTRAMARHNKLWFQFLQLLNSSRNYRFKYAT